ncbi:hypothetical protein RRG08_002636 [Elysia crispata]|uniref:Uncharacterized protein n=1 Tax=Elysia crispata TaxID=231223 RepID=A0AAE0Y4Q5_9GAST|nr:hypothetical protein RRG08_002636 [Elysia crispata]
MAVRSATIDHRRVSNWTASSKRVELLNCQPIHELSIPDTVTVLSPQYNGGRSGQRSPQLPLKTSPEELLSYSLLQVHCRRYPDRELSQRLIENWPTQLVRRSIEHCLMGLDWVNLLVRKLSDQNC